jgi:hypothetical protein
MSRPEEFTIQIEPDGRVIFKSGELEESSYRRILELLEETVGPAQAVEAGQADPPRRSLSKHKDERRDQGLKQGG